MLFNPVIYYLPLCYTLICEMNHIITPGGVGIISLVLSMILFIRRWIFPTTENLNRKVSVIILKIKARVINQAYFTGQKLLFLLRPPKTSKILFSDKDDWQQYIRKGFTKHYKLEFRSFDQNDFKSFDMLVPLTIHDLKTCIDHRERLPKQALPIPSAESLAICDDKLRFNRFMAENGFEKYIPNTQRPLKYPYILKKGVDEYGQNTFIIENEMDEHRHAYDLEDEGFYSQELVSGRHEYATHIVFSKGRITANLNVRYTFSEDNFVKGKQKYICKQVCQTKHLELFAGILGKLGFEGICCFNYKEKDGKPMIFEINPRFGGSLTDYFFSFVRKIGN